MVCGELHVSRKVRDGEAIAFLLLDFGDVRAAVLLLMHDPAEELFEDYGRKTCCLSRRISTGMNVS